MRRLTIPERLLITGAGILVLACLVYAATGFIGLKRENRQLSGRLKTDKAAVFFLKASPSNFYLKPLLLNLPGRRDKHIEALQALFAGPPEKSAGELKLMNIFPFGTEVLNFTLKDGMATVNLNQKATRLNVGSQGEALAVASIVNTLTKFPDVYQVKILIEGKEVESLAGHIDLTNTFHYNDQVVDPVPVTL